MYEDVFILNSARVNLSEDNVSVLKEISKKNIDWYLVDSKANKHGVSTIIYYSLKKNNLLHLIPSWVVTKYQENYHTVGLKNSILIEEINKLSDIIKDKIVLLKGIDLIQSLYPDIAIRFMHDIDILVEKEKCNDIWNKFQSNGYTLNYDLKIRKSSVHEKRNQNPTPKHLPSLRNDKCKIDIHWNLFKKPDSFHITKMAWEKGILVNPDDKTFRLSNEYLIIHLCSHLSVHKHSWNPLRMFCDINEFILKYGDKIDWNNICEICKDHEHMNDISYALTYTHILLKTPIPEKFINEKFINEKLINLDSLIKELENNKSVFRNYLSILKSFNKPADIFIYIFRTVIPSKEWMNANYGTQSRVMRIKAYLKYWSSLFIKHVMKRE